MFFLSIGNLPVNVDPDLQILKMKIEDRVIEEKENFFRYSLTAIDLSEKIVRTFDLSNSKGYERTRRRHTSQINIHDSACRVIFILFLLPRGIGEYRQPRKDTLSISNWRSRPIPGIDKESDQFYATMLV